MRRPSLRLLTALCTLLLCGRLAAENLLTISKSGDYTVDKTVTRIEISSHNDPAPVILRFTADTTKTDTIYTLQGKTDGTTDQSYGLKVFHDTILDIAAGVTVNIAESFKDVNNAPGSAIKLGSSLSTDLTIQGEGTLRCYARNACINAFNESQLIITGSPVVYFATKEDDPAMQGSSATVTIEGGRVHCIANRANISTLSSPSTWELYAASTGPAFDVASVTQTGGALLGAGRTSGTVPTIAETLSSDKTSYKTYAKVAETFTHTGGSCLWDADADHTLSSTTPIPGACYTFGETACTGTFTPDQYGRIFLPATATKHYASANDADAATFFGIEPTYTDEGLVVQYAFGIEGIHPQAQTDGTRAIALTIGIDLPNEPAENTQKELQLVVVETVGENKNEVYNDTATFQRDGTSAHFTATIQTTATIPNASGGAAHYTVTATQ